MDFIISKDNENFSLNYGKVLEMQSLVNREINTISDYVNWVREWRTVHANLVGSIQHMRNTKNDFKNRVVSTNSSREEAMHRAYNTKLALRPFARELYDIRTQNKLRYKSGEFGDPTFKPLATEAA